MPILSPYTLFTMILVCTVVNTHLIRPFHVDLSHGVSRMKTAVRDTRLPSALPSIAGSPSSTFGVDAEWLTMLQASWIDDFDWERHQSYVNSFNHYMTELEGMDIHFVHAKAKASTGSDIIPIILTHGWPSSFLEFLPVVHLLTQPTEHISERSVSFDVVIPSLPGFAFSAPPPPVWTVNDTARIWNTLMVDVLGYTSGYSVAGTDWGALVNWRLLNEYPLVKAAYFNFFAIVPPSLESLTLASVTLNEFERSGMETAGLFLQSGTAYFQVHQTRPWTLGLAMADNPIGQLAWIGEKYREWSDPLLVDVTQILTTVSLYYLTGSFPTSLFVYAQNSGFSSSDVRAETSKPFGYGAFQWEGLRHPKAFIRGLGNLTYYKGLYLPYPRPKLGTHDESQNITVVDISHLPNFPKCTPETLWKRWVQVTPEASPQQWVTGPISRSAFRGIYKILHYIPKNFLFKPIEVATAPLSGILPYNFV